MTQTRNYGRRKTDFPISESLVRIVIADDQLPARNGLKALLAHFPDFEVAGEARDGEEAVQMVEACRPDVVLMDARMPRMSGLEATHEIKTRWPDVRVVITTVYPTAREQPYAREADAFLLKGFGVTELRDAVFGMSPLRPLGPADTGRSRSETGDSEPGAPTGSGRETGPETPRKGGKPVPGGSERS